MEGNDGLAHILLSYELGFLNHEITSHASSFNMLDGRKTLVVVAWEWPGLHQAMILEKVS